MSEIQSYYTNKTVFITGATGFLGKLLVEKLLWACHGLKKIYLLLREKKGVPPQERLNQMFDIPAFDRLKSKYPNFTDKITILNGDLDQLYLGLSKENIVELQENVQIVFHCGANVRFDVSMKPMGITNVRATKYLVDICKKAVRLEAFVYVSTAYSNCDKSRIEERVYEPHIKSGTFLEIIDNFDDDTLEKLTPVLLKDFPNAYTLSKATTEKLILEEGSDLPISIIRPSIISSSFKEPMSGWTDNYYAVTGICTATGLGLLRSLAINPTKRADIIPVDFVVNNIIAVAWDTYKRSRLNRKELMVFNCTSGTRNPITWGEFTSTLLKIGISYASVQGIWYPFFLKTQSSFIHSLLMFFLHTIPALFVDFILILLLKQPRMFKLSKKMNMFAVLTSYFTLKEWSFDEGNTKRLIDSLSGMDKELFPCNVGTINWKDYMEKHIVGMRVYLVKDPLETIPMGRRKYFFLRILHYATITIFFYFTYRFFSFVCGEIFRLV